MIIRDEIELESTTRAGIRNELVNAFLKESPGTGSKEFTSKYNYVAEKIVNQQETHTIILKRPAYLNKGFDFIVTYHGHNFNEGKKTTRKIKGVSKECNASTTSAPSHSHICDDLRLKRNEDGEGYKKLKGLIDKIYNCEAISNTEYSDIKNIFNEGLPAEVTLKLIKWLFIEQDITYWNFSGRAMLYGHINSL